MPFLGGIFVCFLFVVAVMVVVVQLEFNSKSIGKPVSSKRWYPPPESDSGRELEGRDLWLRLALHCPRLKSDGQDNAGHDKSRKTHTHSETEHGVQFVKFYRLHNGASLWANN